MRIRKRRNALILPCEITQRGDRVDELAPNKDECFAHTDDIRVIAYIAACRAEVDYGLCIRAALAEGEHMRHNIVAHLVLVTRGGGIVDIVNMCFHLLYLRIRYIETELFFALGKGDPQPAPG